MYERQMANMHHMHVLYPHMHHMHEGIYKRGEEKDERANEIFLEDQRKKKLVTLLLMYLLS